jgi:hypothetical protein
MPCGGHPLTPTAPTRLDLSLVTDWSLAYPRLQISGL